MRRLGWSEILFILCFLLFGVGGGFLWPSEDIIDAMVGLLVGSVAGVVVWLALLFLIVKARERRDETPPGDG